MNISQAALQFLGTRKQLAKLHVKAIFLMIVTLGIYRFWYKTNVRRYLWNKISFNGDDRFEYLGTGLELLKGFALALLIIVPLNIAASLASLSIFYFPIIAIVTVVALFLGFFALYAARRYLLTRTLWRGLRFRQDGSGLKYAFFAFLWFIPQVLTLGLISPWAKAWLERYAVGNTSFGTAQARFSGTGGALFKSTILITLITLIPLAYAAFIFLNNVNWGDIGDLMTAFKADEEGLLEETYAESSAGTRYALQSLGAALPFWLLVSFLFYPALKAIHYRWFINGLNLGEANFTSHFSGWQSYKIILKAILLITGVTIVFSILSMIIASFVFSGSISNFNMLEILKIYEKSGVGLFLFIGFIFYMALIIGMVLFKALYITFPYWRAQVGSVTAFNLESLEDVVARGQNSSAFGESLADGAADLGF